MDKKLRPAATSETKASVESQPIATGAHPLPDNQSLNQGADSEEDAADREALEELDFLNLKEKKSGAEAASLPKNTLSKLKNTAAQSPRKEALLAILGRCSLPGHIVHFFNLHLEIEKHIRTIEELGDPRFVKAYIYLKNNPATEAVYIYEFSMVAHFRRGSGMSRVSLP